MMPFIPAPSVPALVRVYDAKETINICGINDWRKTITSVVRLLAEHAAKLFAWIIFLSTFDS